MTKVAFVIQRCGLEVNGGAETLCLKIAERMSKYWDLEILTTCALDYVTWANHYPPGLSEVSGVKVRRFRIDETREIKKFNKLSEKIHSHLHNSSVKDQEAWMLAQGPNSSELRRYVEQNHERYDVFVFFTYLYATTYFILPLVKHKAFLAPLAHDEWTIYMSIWDSLFAQPKGFVFNTLEERDFVKARFPKINLEGPIIGIAVDSPETFSAEQFRYQYNIHEPFFLYMGRIDPSKGCEEMFNYFMELKQIDDSQKLVLLGKPTMQIPSHPDIISLGFVDEQTKWNALAACDILLMPSPYESLSIVLLEAWKMCKPVLVNGKCKVLVGQCRRAQGGLWYTNKYEFQVALESMTTSKVRNQLGWQGKKFVENHYTWSVIEQSYLTALTSTVAV